MNFSPRRCWTLTRKECHRFLKVWSQTIFNPAIPAVLYISVFSVAFGKAIPQVGMISYTHFIVPGMILLQATSAAFQNSSSSIIISKYHGTIYDLLTTPLTATEKLIGFLIGGVMRALMVTVIIMATAFLIVGDLPLPQSPWLLVALLTIIYANFTLLGVLTGIWAKTFDHVGSISTFILLPMTFLGGIFNSITMLPAWAQTASKFNPFIYFADGARVAWFGSGDLPLELSLAVTCGICVAMSALVYWAFATNWRLQT